MATYLIADIALTDPLRYREYAERVPALIARHGGRYLVRAGDTEVLEGNWRPNRLVVLEFPDRAAAEAFYQDPDYQPLKDLRIATSTGSVLLVDGY